MPTANFNFQLVDFYSPESFISAAGTNQINYTPDGISKPLKTTGATDPNPSKSITTWSYSDIMQGAAALKPVAATYDVFNQTLSKSFVDILNKNGGTDTLLGNVNGLNYSAFAPYDIINQANKGGTATQDAMGKVVGGALNNQNQAGGANSIAGLAGIAVQTALDQLGKAYVWGAVGPDYFDCSGLMLFAWGKAGITIPHYTVTQYAACDHITQDQMRQGDLVYYHDFQHVGMFIGDAKVVHAPHTGDVVKISSITANGAISGIGRVRQQ